MLTLSSRTLLADGTSVLTVDAMAELLVKTDEVPNYIKVEESEDAKLFLEKYGIDLQAKLEDIPVSPQFIDTLPDEDIIERLVNSPRFVNEDRYVKRFVREIDYFRKDEKLQFVYTLMKLVERFKQDGVVWGVGRGSSCASYVLYLVEVHDVDPVKYGIDFREFSKETEDQDV
jgi:DNA polymerase III alpha subunit